MDVKGGWGIAEGTVGGGIRWREENRAGGGESCGARGGGKVKTGAARGGEKRGIWVEGGGKREAGCGIGKEIGGWVVRGRGDILERRGCVKGETGGRMGGVSSEGINADGYRKRIRIKI